MLCSVVAKGGENFTKGPILAKIFTVLQGVNVYKQHLIKTKKHHKYRITKILQRVNQTLKK